MPNITEKYAYRRNGGGIILQRRIFEAGDCASVYFQPGDDSLPIWELIEGDYSDEAKDRCFSEYFAAQERLEGAE